MVRDGARTFTNDYFVRNRRKKDAEELGNIAMLCICLYTIHNTYIRLFVSVICCFLYCIWPNQTLYAVAIKFIPFCNRTFTNTDKYHTILPGFLMLFLFDRYKSNIRMRTYLETITSEWLRFYSFRMHWSILWAHCVWWM